MYNKVQIKSKYKIFNVFAIIHLIFELYTYCQKELLNAGKDCWGGCGRRQGPCDWCGSGLCCRKGWWDTRNGCDGSIGEDGKGHVCAPVPNLNELRNAGKDCWRGCGRQQGPCDWCGSGFCCRKGWWDKRNGCDGSIGEDGKGHVCAPGMTLTPKIQSLIFIKRNKDIIWNIGNLYVFFLSHFSTFHSDDRSSYQ